MFSEPEPGYYEFTSRGQVGRELEDEERELRRTVQKLSREFDVPLFGAGVRR
jgi:hypothetical protein